MTPRAALFLAATLALPPTAGARASEGPTPPVLSLRDGKPTINLGPDLFTARPTLRLDADFGGFFGQRAYPGGGPPRLGDRDRRGVPDDLLNMRRARLGLSGTLWRDFEYSFVWDFAPGPGRQIEPAVNSRLYELQLAYTGFGRVTPRIGAFTPNHTIEFAMSSFELPLLERPTIGVLATSLASGDSRIALGGEARGERWLAAAYLTDGTSTALNDGRQRGFATRAVGLLADRDGFRLALGANAAGQFRPGTRGAPDEVRLRDFPELRLEPTRLLDTGALRAGAATALGLEFAAVLGRLYLQAEYQWIRVDGRDGQPDSDFTGHHVTALYPLLGAARRWDGKRGVFTRPDFAPLDPAAGQWGYAELVARWSHAALSDGGVRGGRQGVASVGLNHYPTRNLRLSLQYSHGTIRLDGPDRAFQALAGRIALNW